MITPLPREKRKKISNATNVWGLMLKLRSIELIEKSTITGIVLQFPDSLYHRILLWTPVKSFL